MLGAFAYSPTRRAAHRRVAAAARRAGAGVVELPHDVLHRRCGGAAVVSYWMNRLQGSTSADEYLVTLNARDRIDPDSGDRRDGLRAPALHAGVRRRAARLAGLATDRTAFAGAYHGLGLPRGRLSLRRGGRRVLRGRLVTTASLRPTRSPCLVVGTVEPCTAPHAPTAPRASATASTSGWSTSTTLPRAAVVPAAARPVRPARPPRRPPTRTIRGERRAASWRCTAYGSDTAGGCVMLANARVLGHVFDPLTRVLVPRPLTVRWVRRRRGAQHVRRAARLPARPGRAGPGPADKAVLRLAVQRRLSGPYDMRFTLDDARVGTTIVLRRAVTAWLLGRHCRPRPCPATRSAVIRQLATKPLMPQRVSALIRVARHLALAPATARSSGARTTPPRKVSDMTVSTTMRWPSIARTPRAPLHATIARAIFERAVHRVPVRVTIPDGAGARRRHQPRGPRVPHRAAGRVLRPARPRHQGRLRRGVHGGRLESGGGHRPGGPAHAVRRPA